MFDKPQKKYLPILIGTCVIATVGTVQSRTVDAVEVPIRTFETIEIPSAVLGQEGSSVTPEVLIRVAVSNQSTSRIVRPLDGAGSECNTVEDEYIVSCLAGAFRAAAKAVKSSQPDYRDARKILSATAKRLDNLQKANADKKAPAKKGKNGRYRAVKKEAAAGVKKAALKIVQEAETQLLRSAGSSKRQVHYQRIAQAVGSTKVILRS